MPLTSSPNSLPNSCNIGLSHFLYNSELLLTIQLSPSDLNRIGIGLGALLICLGVPQKIIRNMLKEDGEQRIESIHEEFPGSNISKVKEKRLENDLYTGTTILFSLITLARARNNIKRNIRDDDRDNPIRLDEIIQQLKFYGITGGVFIVFFAISIRYFKNPPFGGDNKETEKTNETKK